MKRFFDPSRMKTYFDPSRMKAYFDPSRMNFIFLIPLAAKALSGDPLAAKDVQETFVGNTVTSQFDAGPAYALVAPNGVMYVSFPAEGRITGKYTIAEDGTICVTWNRSAGAVENCGKVVKEDDEKYTWNEKTLKVLKGDPRSLAKT